MNFKHLKLRMHVKVSKGIPRKIQIECICKTSKLVDVKKKWDGENKAQFRWHKE